MRRVVATACALVLLGALSACSDDATDTRNADASSPTSAATPGVEATGSAEPDEQDSDSAGNEGESDPDRKADPTRIPTPDSSPSSGENETRSRGTDKGGIELPTESGDPSEDATGLPGLDQDDDSPAASGPLVRRPFPRAASARERLVRGYPVAVLRPVPGSRVTSNGVSPSGARLQVTLTATSGASPVAVRTHFRRLLGGLGFSESDLTSAAGSTALAYARGGSSVTLTVRRSAGATSYSLLAVLDAKG